MNWFMQLSDGQRLVIVMVLLVGLIMTAISMVDSEL
jgi:hypothetical protein